MADVLIVSRLSPAFGHFGQIPLVIADWTESDRTRMRCRDDTILSNVRQSSVTRLNYRAVMTPLETVNEFMRRFCTMDLDSACELVSDDVEYDNVPMGKNFGPDGIKTFAGGMNSQFDSVEFIVHREVATGNTVFNERTDRFVRGELTFDLLVAGVFEVSDAGLITLWRDYFDMGKVTEMLTALAG
jgi:limonene-1,2-epoxide hydrolase